MSTSSDIVTKAMRRLGLLANGETPSARDSADGIDALNSMVASWATKGVVVGGDLPLGPEHDKAVVALLAVDIAGNFGDMAPPASVVRDASDGWAGLCGAFMRAPAAQFDPALTNMPMRMGSDTIGGIMGYYVPWLPVTDYAIGDRVIYRGVVYECTTGGTSASTYGPTEKDSSVTDGTVVWEYVGST